MNNSDMPITPYLEVCENMSPIAQYTGLTKREYFAGLAMQGFLNSDFQADDICIAKWSVSQADALLKALEEVT